MSLTSGSRGSFLYRLWWVAKGCLFENSLILFLSQSQYIFLHDALKELIICGETEIQAHNLMSVVSKLKEVARNETDEAPEEWQDNVTGFERQYKVGIIGH